MAARVPARAARSQCRVTAACIWLRVPKRRIGGSGTPTATNAPSQASSFCVGGPLCRRGCRTPPSPIDCCLPRAADTQFACPYFPGLAADTCRAVANFYSTRAGILLPPFWCTATLSAAAWRCRTYSSSTGMAALVWPQKSNWPATTAWSYAATCHFLALAIVASLPVCAWPHCPRGCVWCWRCLDLCRLCARCTQGGSTGRPARRRAS